MKTVTASNARKYISSLLNEVVETNETVGITRHNRVEVVLMKVPREYQSNVSDITKVNAYGGAFDFLRDEPDLYTVADIKKRYV